MPGLCAVIKQAVGLGLLAMVLGGCVVGMSQRAQAAAEKRRNAVPVPLRVMVDFDTSQPRRGLLSPDDHVTVVIYGGRPPYMATATGTGLNVEQPTQENRYRAIIQATKEAKGMYSVDIEDGAGHWKRIEFEVKAPSQ